MFSNEKQWKKNTTTTTRYEAGLLTEHAEPVVHRHDDDVAVGGQDAGVKHVSRPLHEGAPVDEQHHGLLAAVPDICVCVGTHTVSGRGGGVSDRGSILLTESDTKSSRLFKRLRIQEDNSLIHPPVHSLTNSLTLFRSHPCSLGQPPAATH